MSLFLRVEVKMELLFVLFLVSLTPILSVSGTDNYSCDFKFGDSTWNYSQVFYNQDISFPAGAKQHTVILPAQKGLMISYVCINLPDVGVDKKTTTGAYHPLEREVSVVLARPALQDFAYHIYAKRHGF